MTKTIYIQRGKADKWMLGIRRVLARLPGLGIIVFIIWMFLRDPIWPYHLLYNSWTQAMMHLFTDPEYRNWWMYHYLAVVIILVGLTITLTIAMKMGVWNKAFKTLKVRTREQQDKIETEIGRVYWIEGYSGQWAVNLGKAVLRGLHIADIKVGKDPKKQYRKLRNGLPVSAGVYKETSSQNTEKKLSSGGEIHKRTIFYKATMMPPINPFSPHRSMHRLVISLPNEAIVVHDGTTMMVEGANLKRDLTQDYPTFELTPESLNTEPLDLGHYKGLLDDDIQKATFTTNIASQMDTFLLKDQRKFQEISVPVNPVMAELVKGVKHDTGSQGR